MFLLPQDTWEMRTRKYMEEKKEKLNRGIFATKDIEAGTIIGDYIGLIIPEEKEDDYESSDEMYLMYYDDGVTVYPDVESAGIHVLNHSCEPNCFMYTYKGHTLFFALRKIYKGEEMTVSYQLSPMDDDCEPCTHMCYCKTPSCTGTMHMEQVKYDLWREFDDAETEKTKTVKANVGDTLALLDEYPKAIADDVIYKLYGSLNVPVEKLTDTKLPKIQKIRELIRKTGKRLSYTKLGVTVLGTEGNRIFLEEN